jgi:hypothetical protein
MMNKRPVMLLSVLLLTISLMIIFNVLHESDTDTITGIDNHVTSDDVVEEIQITLLEEDDDIEIGEMI